MHSILLQSLEDPLRDSECSRSLRVKGVQWSVLGSGCRRTQWRDELLEHEPGQARRRISTVQCDVRDGCGESCAERFSNSSG